MEIPSNIQQSQPSLTDRLNKYLLCAYLDRLNEEDSLDGEQLVREEDAIDADTAETFTDWQRRYWLFQVGENRWFSSDDDGRVWR